MSSTTVIFFQNGNTALHYAVKCLVLTEALLEAGADPNHANKKGDTPMHKVRPVAEDVVAKLISHGADPEVKNHLGKTPGYSTARIAHNFVA